MKLTTRLAVEGLSERRRGDVRDFPEFVHRVLAVAVLLAGSPAAARMEGPSLIKEGGLGAASALISLVYSGTRFDQWSAILHEAFRWGLRMIGFLAAIAVTLFLLGRII